MAALARLENNVAQFVGAIKHANSALSELQTTPAKSIRTDSTAASNQPASEIDTPLTSNASTPLKTSQDDLTAQLRAALEGLPGARKAGLGLPSAAEVMDPQTERRKAFTEMRREWMVWGESLMKTLESWLDRPDLGIADRVRVIGLADRLAWYGVRGSRC